MKMEIVSLLSALMTLTMIGQINPAISLSATFGLIASGLLVSLWKTREALPLATPK